VEFAISHKKAANGTDTLVVLAAQKGDDEHNLSLWAPGINLGPFFMQHVTLMSQTTGYAGEYSLNC